jgi:desampylase
VVVERLVFPEALRLELVDLAKRGNPYEVCGVLAGTEDRVERVYPVRNVADTIRAEDRTFRDRETGAPADGRLETEYYMDPLDYLRVEDEIDSQGLRVVGLYHSHTRHEARPSATDIRLANWLEVFYVLVSLADDRHPPVRAWRIVKDSPFASNGDVREVALA